MNERLNEGEPPLELPNKHVRNVMGKIFDLLTPEQLGLMESWSIGERIIFYESLPGDHAVNRVTEALRPLADGLGEALSPLHLGTGEFENSSYSIVLQQFIDERAARRRALEQSDS